jgi:hypothetical protein
MNKLALLCLLSILCFPVLLQAAESDVKVSSAPARPKETYFYNTTWEGAGEFNITYGFARHNWMYQYIRENALSYHPNYTHTISYGLGYTNLNADTDVTYSNGVKLTGKFKADVVPLSICTHWIIKSGFWKGRFGIGYTMYYYSGKIDMAPYDGVYSGSGTGSNIVIPGELAIGNNLDKKSFFKVNYEIQIPITKNKYTLRSSYMEGYAHTGIFLGLSFGRYW